MSYTSLAAVTTKMALMHVREALQQTGSETEEELDQAFANLMETVDNEIDSLLGARFTVPFQNPPAKVKHAAFIFALEALYGARYTSEQKNPWANQAKSLRLQLKEIGDGDAPLTPALDTPAHSSSPGAVIASPSPVSSTSLPC